MFEDRSTHLPDAGNVDSRHSQDYSFPPLSHYRQDPNPRSLLPGIDGQRNVKAQSLLQKSRTLQGPWKYQSSLGFSVAHVEATLQLNSPIVEFCFIVEFSSTAVGAWATSSLSFLHASHLSLCLKISDLCIIRKENVPEKFKRLVEVLFCGDEENCI